MVQRPFIFQSLGALLAALILACGGGAPEVLEGSAIGESAGQSDKADKTDEAYSIQTPHEDASLSEDAQEQMQAALEILAGVAANGGTLLQQELARETLARITESDVLIGAIRDARGVDLWHMCKDYQLPACEDMERPDADWLGTEELRSTLIEELDGYMWGNRLYFQFGSEQDAESLAATLVHEVNHALNRSECSYYSDLDAHVVDNTLAFVEEYRAFFAECFYTHGNTANLDTCHEQTLTDLEERGYPLVADLSPLLPDGENDTREFAVLLMDNSGFVPEWVGHLVPDVFHWPTHFDPCDEAFPQDG